MHTRITLITILLASVLTSCNLASPQGEPTAIQSPTPSLEFAQPTTIQPIAPTPPVVVCPVASSTPLTPAQAVLDQAFAVVVAIKNKDMAALSAYVDPQRGLRFSPYAAVTDENLVFTVDKIPGLFDDPSPYTWGAYSGSGESIDLSFADYYQQFIYDEDFAAAPQMALNHRLGVSTSMDNSAEYYPGSMIVEFYFPGFDPQFEGMDWRSLRLVFIQGKDTWYLVGIIHDQWTT